MPVRFTRAAFRAAIHAARLAAHSRRQTQPRLRPQPVEGLLLDDAQRRAGAHRVEHVPGDDGRPPRGRILMQRRLDHRRSLEHQPFRSRRPSGR